MYKTMIDKRIALAVLFMLCGGMAFGQSQPSTPLDCGEYQWPAVQSPCPEVQIKQRHDHTPKPQYRHYGWDTVIDCNTREGIELSCMPYIPVQKFNGTYTVDEIPFNPPDPTFCQGTRMPISTDDNFSNYSTNIPYPFYFFGIRKTSFVLGANGLVAFGPVPVSNTTGTGPSCPWS